MNYSGATSSRQPLGGVRSRGDASREQSGDDSASDFIDFVESNFNSKNWRGIFIALLVIGAISGLIILTILLVTPDKTPESIREQLNLGDLFDDRFHPRHPDVRWSTDANVFRYRSPEGDIVEFNADENRSQIILHNSSITAVEVDKWFVSGDGLYILVAVDAKSIYSHSFSARYEIHERHHVETPAESRPIPFPYSKDMETWKDVELQYAGWAPKGHALVFVYKNDIYYQASPSSESLQLTNTGSEGTIFNGVPDWLYEEEILHSNVGLWWSPDGKYIAYLCINDTSVPSYRFPIYASAYGGSERIVETPYPKAGDERPGIVPIVQLYVIDTTLTKGTQRLIEAPHVLANQDYYVSIVAWRDANSLLVTWTFRAQDKAILTICNAASSECHENLVEQQHDGKGWVEIASVRFIEAGEKYLTILPQIEPETGYWKHVTLVTSKVDVVNDRKQFVTSGPWDVTEIVGYSDRLQAVYFIAAKEDPKQRHIYRSFLPTGKGRQDAYPECLTCYTGDICRYYSAQFSADAEYYVEGCLGPDVPIYTLKMTANQTNVITLEDNDVLRRRLEVKAIPTKEYFQFSSESGYRIWGQLTLMPHLKRGNVSAIPLLVHVHAEPGTQLVTEEFRVDWLTYLASKGDVVVAAFDVRGTGGRGDRYLHEVYKKVGTVEVQDQIKGASHVISKYPFIRKDRLAVWGEGYGGFVASHVLGDKDDGTFACGVAASPVSDWRYYDVVYAERLMGSAGSKGNYRGYDNANVSSKADNFRNKSLLLIHGTANDKIHVQHSALLGKALTESGIEFKLHLYADEGRRLLSNRRNQRSASGRHAYQTMEAFLRSDCWLSSESLAVRKTSPPLSPTTPKPL